MEALIVGLILAAVSAAGFIAYRHPEVYLDTFIRFVLAIGAVGLLVAIWNWSNDFATAKLMHFVPPAAKDAASRAADSVALSDWRFYAVGCGFIVYLLILQHVARYFEKHKP
jgi:hypothetical protein